MCRSVSGSSVEISWSLSAVHYLSTLCCQTPGWSLSCVTHLAIGYCLKLLCCGSLVGCAVDHPVDLSCLSHVDLLADLPCVSLVDLLADLLVDLIALLPLHSMVLPLPKCSMHLWTADWVMNWLLSHRRVACIFSLSISRMCRTFEVLKLWNCHTSPFRVLMGVELIYCQLSDQML